jgi:hypothetical protein
MMMETFGIQLDDDSLLALYHVYDQECTGFLKYEELMRVLLDFDYFALYTGNNDITQATLDLATVKSMVATIKAKFKSSVAELRKVLRCLDTQHSGESLVSGFCVTKLLEAGGFSSASARRVLGSEGLHGRLCCFGGDLERCRRGLCPEPGNYRRRWKDQMGRLHQTV